jgi:hypothetical protein
MSFAGLLNQVSWVLLVALLALLAFVLFRRMAHAMRKSETQGMFTEFTRDRDEWKGEVLHVEFRIPKQMPPVEITCEWHAPEKQPEVIWKRTFSQGDHAIQFDTSGMQGGRHSYRLVTQHQVMERFLDLRR